MKSLGQWRWKLMALLLGFGTAVVAHGQELEIETADSQGKLSFNRVESAESYRVEWASSLSGPWTNFATASADLDSIPQFASGSYTCLVPMCYRVVAVVTGAVPEGMALIPGGTNAGTNPLGVGESYEDWYPETYNLTVNSFYMDKYEVTKAQWDEVYTWAITNGYSFDNAGSGKATNHPVQEVNWYDCVKWCNARSQKEGRPAVYTVGGAVYKTGQSNDVVQTAATGYRLPTDEEWEYAARGGEASRRFPWGDSDEIQHARANYYSVSSDSYDTSPTRGYHPTYATGGEPYTSPVGVFAANGYGLYDMCGNVWEWCFDWYPGHEGSYRVIRGGSWGSYAGADRVANRSHGSPGGGYYGGGFRAALPAGQ